jgi:hypothetical protein
MKKKRYNPFKMVGPWIGLFIGLLISLIVRTSKTLLNLPRLFSCNGNIDGGCWTSSIFSNMIYLVILGFILGWLVHLLIRRYYK